MTDRLFSRSTKSFLGVSLWTWTALVIFVALGVVANIHAYVGGLNSTLNGGVGGDGGQDPWFLAVVAHEFIHGNFSFFSSTVNVPRGINLSNMTSMPLLGILASPITLLVGPIATYNLLISLCFTTAGLSMYFAARRFTDFAPGALLAGLAYACSPYMVGEGLGHVFLLATAVFPLWVVAVHEVLVRQKWSKRTAGAFFGILIVAQAYIAIEPAVSAIMLSLAALLVLWLLAKKTRYQKANYAVGATLWGAGIAAPFMAWFGYSYFLGKAHGAGDVRSAASVRNLSAAVTSFIAPGSNQRVHFGFAHHADAIVNYGIKNIVADPPENAAYIGIPLLILLLTGMWWLRRDHRVQLFSGLMGLSLLMSMGSFSRFGNSSTSVPLPFWVFSHLPVLKSTIAIRWNLFTWLFLSFLLAIILGEVAQLVRRKGLRSTRLVVVATSALTALSVVSLIPALPYGASPAYVPPYFTSSALDALPTSSVMVTYPLAVGGAPLPMLWQAVGKFHFHLLGGEVGSQAMKLGATRTVFDSCLTSTSLTPDMVALIPEVRSEFSTWGVTNAALPMGYAPNETCGEEIFNDVFQTKPTLVDGTYVWSTTQG